MDLLALVFMLKYVGLFGKAGTIMCSEVVISNSALSQQKARGLLSSNLLRGEAPVPISFEDSVATQTLRVRNHNRLGD